MLGFEGYTLKSAYFTDNAKTVVNVVWAHDTEDDVMENLIASIDKDGRDVKGSKAWNNLLKYITIDELHKNTYEYFKSLREEYERNVIIIAKREGIIEDTRHKDGFDIILETIAKEIDEETLFKFKLKVFDIESVKKCDDRSIKAEIRKAKSIAEVIGALAKV